MNERRKYQRHDVVEQCYVGKRCGEGGCVSSKMINHSPKGVRLDTGPDFMPGDMLEIVMGSQGAGRKRPGQDCRIGMVRWCGGKDGLHEVGVELATLPVQCFVPTYYP